MSKRHRRLRRHYREYGEKYRCSHRRYRSKKARGWGMNLYRNTRDGKIAGVAAGLADHWDFAHWVMRLIWVGAFIFTGTMALWAYIAAWIILAPRPHRRHNDKLATDEDYFDDDAIEVEMEYDERQHGYRPRRVFRYSEASGVRLKRARERLDTALKRVEDMESYVTSRQFELNREFSRL